LLALDQLMLVTTSDCHFCDHAHQVLDELRLEPRELDVGSAGADELARRGIPLAFLPVLTDGERVIAYGRFSARRLRRDLEL
jgi:glutaredoxin